MENSIYLLHQTLPGDRAVITRVLAQGDIRRRLLDLGFIEGTTVKCVLKEPRGESAAYLVRGTTIALRKEDAKEIVISHENERL